MFVESEDALYARWLGVGNMRQRDPSVCAYIVVVWTSDNEPNLPVVEKVRRDNMAGFRISAQRGRGWPWLRCCLLSSRG